MRAVFITLLIMLAACETVDPLSDRSILSGVSPGTLLVLHQDLAIPEDERRVHISLGRVTDDPDDFDVTCYFRVLNEDTTVVRADRFVITDYSRDREEIRDGDIERYLTVYSLRSERQPTVLRLVCNKWDSGNLGRPITQAQVKKALGTLVSFEAPGAAEPVQ